MFKFPASLQYESSDEFFQEKISFCLLLKEVLVNYFPSVTSCTNTINLFSVDPVDLPVGFGKQEELIDIQSDEKNEHKAYIPLKLWLSMASSYPTLAHKAITQLLIFPTTWECEQGFSTFVE